MKKERLFLAVLTACGILTFASCGESSNAIMMNMILHLMLIIQVELIVLKRLKQVIKYQVGRQEEQIIIC